MLANGPEPLANLSSLVSPRERVYFALMVAFSLVSWGLLALAMPAILATSIENAVVLIYVPVIALVYFLLHAYAVGHLRGNGIRVTPHQFPVIHRLVTSHARALGLKKPPPVYVVQAGGVLNAFAIKFFTRQFVVLYSDIVALAVEEGEGVLGFIVAHELAHIRRGHLRFRLLNFPGRLFPYLGKAWSRACEYTCDRFAAECEPEHAVAGLLVLAAGRSLYQTVDATTFAEQVETEASFWVRRAEIVSTHPILPKRVAALLKAGMQVPVRAAVQ